MPMDCKEQVGRCLTNEMVMVLITQERKKEKKRKTDRQTDRQTERKKERKNFIL